MSQVTDHLPSLLALPDAQLLPILEDFLYHPNELVRQYTMYSLYLFDNALIARWAPDVIRRHGPTRP